MGKSKSVTDRDQAVQLLVHYISLCMMKAGLNPDGDTEAELGQLVDHIIEASVAAASEDLKQYGYLTDDTADFLRANDLSDHVKSDALL